MEERGDNYSNFLYWFPLSYYYYLLFYRKCSELIMSSWGAWTMQIKNFNFV
jgi:hypothetical protein